MTTLMLQAKPFVRMAAPRLRIVHRQFLEALDAFAAERMRNAVPRRLRRASGAVRHAELADAIEEHVGRH